jgi:hypothetical protein
MDFRWGVGECLALGLEEARRLAVVVSAGVALT